MSYYHIQRQIFDVSTDSEFTGRALHNKLSKLYHNQLEAALERLFDRVIPKDMVLRLNTLEVDAGALSYYQIDTDLVDHIIDDLERQLSVLVTKQRQAGELIDTNSDALLAVSHIGILEYFLLHGVLPWWSKSLEFTSVNELLIELISSQEQVVRTVILKIGHFAQVQKRLAWQFPVASVKKVVELLEPAEAAFIFGYHDEVTGLQRERNIVKQEATTFSRLVWEFIFKTLLSDVSGRFNRKMFVKSNVASIASYFNLSFNDVLRILQDAGDTPYIKSSHFELFQLVDELWDEEKSNDRTLIDYIDEPQNDSEQVTAIALKSELELIYYYLTHGSLPVLADIDDVAELTTILLRLIGHVPQAVLTMLHSLDAVESAGIRIANVFDEPAIIAVVRLEEPANAEFIIEYHKSVNRIHQTERLINIEQAAFSKAIWALVLDYLLINHGSEFNRRIFLEQNIRSIAGRYNLNVTELATTLRTSAGHLMAKSSFLDQLYEVLDTITSSASGEAGSSGKNKLKEARADDEPFAEDERRQADEAQVAQDKQKQERISDLKSKAGRNDSEDEELKAADQTERISEQEPSFTFYRDVLLYWLKNGSLPGWYKGDLPPTAIFTRLLNARTEILLQIFYYASSSAVFRDRLIKSINNEILYQAIQRFTGGTTAIEAAQDLAEIMQRAQVRESLNMQEGFSLLKLAELNAGKDNQLRRLLIMAIWETYETGAWHSFDLKVFIKNFIQQLSLWFGSDHVALVKALSSEVKSDSRFARLKAALKEVDISRKGYEFAGEAAGNILSEGDSWLAEVLRRYQKNAGIKRGTPPEEVLLSILSYLLQHNALPAGLDISVYQATALIRRLMTILLKQKPQQLLALFQNTSDNIQARIRIHNIFISPADYEAAPVRNFLHQFLEQDLARYLSSGSGISGGTELSDFLRFFEASEDGGRLSPARLHLLQRMMRQHSLAQYISRRYSDEQVYQLIAYKPGLWQDAAQFIRDVSSFFSKELANTEVYQTLATALRAFNLMYFLGSNLKPAPEDYVEKLFQYFRQSFIRLSPEQLERLLALDVRPNEVSVSFYRIITHIKALLRAQLEFVRSVKLLKHLEKDNRQQKTLPLSNAALANEIRENQQDRKPSLSAEKAPIQDGDGFIIHNAGLILLHPFLFTYFNRLNMVENGAFKDEVLHKRAIHLLQLLVDFTTDKPEEDLLLNKVLAGMAPEGTIEHAIEATEAEREMANGLLNAVIQQWDKIKNTSVAGFQASFLQREGKLTFTNDNWHLRVEPRAYDLLLQTLPWGIGFIKLPWMPNTLNVEWELK